MRNIGAVLLFIALGLLIQLLVESSEPRHEAVSIVGADSDSAGGRYIRMNNGEVYHRRAQSGSNTNGSTSNASSFDNGSQPNDLVEHSQSRLSD